MRHKPVFGMFISMAVGAEIILYCWSMFDIGMTVIAGDLIVRDMGRMHKIEVAVFCDPSLDIMT